MGPIVKQFINAEIKKALYRHSLSSDNPLRSELEAGAMISEGGHDAVVYVRDESGCVMTLDQRIGQLRHDPQFSRYFPADPPRVSRNDGAKLRENFSKIASGQVVVE